MIGNLCSDPVARTTNKGKSQSSFRLAVQRQFKGASGTREADFFNVVVFGPSADFVNNYLGKGRKVAIDGSIQNRSYEAQDGSKKWVTEIIAQSVEALGGRDTASQEAANAGNDYSNDFTEVDDPELPDYF